MFTCNQKYFRGYLLPKQINVNFLTCKFVLIFNLLLIKLLSKVFEIILIHFLKFPFEQSSKIKDQIYWQELTRVRLQLEIFFTKFCSNEIEKILFFGQWLIVTQFVVGSSRPINGIFIYCQLPWRNDSYTNNVIKREAAIAQWILLHPPSCGPGFESQAHNLPIALYNSNL